jgi:hypothetical protein
MQFTLSSGYCRYGCWGLTDDISNPNRNYKYGAIKSIVGGPSAIKAAASGKPLLQLTISSPASDLIVFRYIAEPGREPAASLYTVSGRLIKSLCQSTPETGIHEAVLNTKQLANGLYLFRLVCGNTQIERCVTVMK